MKIRIISGKYGGRFINVPNSDLIRPTSNRLRETLFNILINKISFDGIKVLELYAGSGALGFECLSRGATEVHFVENNFAICSQLEKNIQSLSANDYCKIYKVPALKFCKNFVGEKYDLILADPPYFSEDIYKVVECILTNKYLNPASFMIIERSIQTKDKDCENFGVIPFKIIGDTCLYEIKN